MTSFVHFDGVQWNYGHYGATVKPDVAEGIWLNPDAIACITTGHHEDGTYSIVTTVSGKFLYLWEDPATVIAKISEES